MHRFESFAAEFFRCPFTGRVYGKRAFFELLAAANEHLRFGMVDNLEAGAPQQRLGAGAVGNPPVGWVAGIFFFNEIHFWKAGFFKNGRLAEWIILVENFNLVHSELNGLNDKEIFGDVLVNEVQGLLRMPQVVKNAMQQDHVELHPQVAESVG